MKKLLTIAIAAYNKEKELARCLDSLIVEKDLMESVQVLVVNDGSSDRTSEIAHAYESDYPECIVAVDQTNGNYGKVMNTALKLAEGKYFRTLDADDWYDKDAYVSFLREIASSDADMVVSERIDFISGENTLVKRVSSFENSVATGVDMSISEVDWQKSNILDNMNVQHITYKTNLLRESGLVWLEGISYTDTMFDFWPLDLVRTVRFVDKEVYVYLTGSEEQSMSVGNIMKNFRHFEKIASAMLEKLDSNPNENSPIFEVKCHYIVQIMGFLYYSLIFNRDNMKPVVKLHCGFCKYHKLAQRIKQGIRYHGVHYTKYLEKGRLPLSIRIMKRLGI